MTDPRTSHRRSRLGLVRVASLSAAFLWALAGTALGQKTTDLFLSNDSTTVSKISFKFFDTRTFDPDQLKAQIVTRAPGFWDKLRRALPLLSYDRDKYRLDPVELQKDVVRLRLFYRRNGFLNPFIDYPASQLDTTRNTIHVIFNVKEGPPLVIEDVLYTGPDGRFAIYQFPEDLKPRWRKLRDQTRRRIGQRFTEAQLVILRSEVLKWLQDRGYAFARVDAEAQTDSAAHKVDLHFTVDAGPMAYFDEVIVEGNRSVSAQVVRRELPFRKGMRFSNSRLVRGQRELFGLNLFRVALVEVPPAPEAQPRDSTVTVRVRVREARPRYVTAETGWAREDGLLLQTDGQHRNFLGSARQFTLSARWRTGWLSLPQTDRQAVRSFNVSASLRQPYLFTTRLSAFFAPFLSWYDDQNQLGARFYEFGVNTTFVYELLSFRTLTLQHTFARAVPLGGSPLADTLNVYNRNVLFAGATMGRVNNFQNPRRGFLIRPSVEGAGLLNSGVAYFKAALEAVGYLPLTDRVSMSARVSVGRLRPFGSSRAQNDQQVEFRFDPVRFYAGGSGDVRGWALQLLGEKYARPVGRDSTRFIYEAVGGEGRMVGSVEVRWPFPGLGSRWGLATFLDAGQVSGTLLRDEQGRVLRDANGNPILGKEDLFDFRKIKYGVGAGVRYRTPVGPVRFDVAFKLNPSDEDLQRPEERFLYDIGARADPPPKRFLNRFNLHLSIGRTF